MRQTVGGTASYFLTDQQGTTRALADASGSVASTLDYDSFGNVISGSASTRYTYTGRESDSEIGLMYYRARWYDPAQGHFISEDPIGFGGGANFYSYVGNNPTNFTDPSGLCPQKPEGDTISVTNAGDLKALLTDFYKQYQKKLARCIWSVFSTDRNGGESNVAAIMPHQTLRNAPVSNIALGYSSSQIGGQGMTYDKTGTIYIANLLRGTPLDNGRQVYAREQFFRVYAHELGNRLSWLYTGNGATFGTNGIDGQAVPFGIHTVHVGEYADTDTGARLEKCIWDDVSF